MYLYIVFKRMDHMKYRNKLLDLKEFDVFKNIFVK